MESLFKSILKIVYDYDQPALGTGFIISIEDSLAVTCAHVVNDAEVKPGEQIKFFYKTNRDSDWVKGSAIVDKETFDSKLDIAILTSLQNVPDDARPVTLIDLEDIVSFRHHDFESIGFPETGTQWSIAYGDVIGFTKQENGAKTIQLASSSIDGGNSGGPLYIPDPDFKGVAGIISSRLDERGSNLKGFAYAIPSSVLINKVSSLKPKKIVDKSRPGVLLCYREQFFYNGVKCSGSESLITNANEIASFIRQKNINVFTENQDYLSDQTESLSTSKLSYLFQKGRSCQLGIALIEKEQIVNAAGDFLPVPHFLQILVWMQLHSKFFNLVLFCLNQETLDSLKSSTHWSLIFKLLDDIDIWKETMLLAEDSRILVELNTLSGGAKKTTFLDSMEIQLKNKLYGILETVGNKELQTSIDQSILPIIISQESSAKEIMARCIIEHGLVGFEEFAFKLKSHFQANTQESVAIMNILATTSLNYGEVLKFMHQLKFYEAEDYSGFRFVGLSTDFRRVALWYLQLAVSPSEELSESQSHLGSDAPKIGQQKYTFIDFDYDIHDEGFVSDVDNEIKKLIPARKRRKWEYASDEKKQKIWNEEIFPNNELVVIPIQSSGIPPQNEIVKRLRKVENARNIVFFVLVDSEKEIAPFENVLFLRHKQPNQNIEDHYSRLETKLFQ